MKLLTRTEAAERCQLEAKKPSRIPMAKASGARGNVRALKSRKGDITGFRAVLPRHVCAGGKRDTVGDIYASAEEARVALDLELERLKGVKSGSVAWAPPNRPGVYAVRGAGGYIKIGCSRTSVSERMKHLQTTHPIRLVFMAILSEDWTDESSIHERFREFHMNGEWFRPAAPLLAFIRERSA